MPPSKLQQFGDRLSKALKWFLAAMLATMIAGLVAFTGWVLSLSTLPPFGGNIWILIIIPSALTWIATMAFLIILETRRN